MKWPHRRRRNREHQVTEAEQKLREVTAKWPAVREAAHTMKSHRETNGFADLIREAMGVQR